MTLKDFITAFITKLNDNNIKHCILRNYEYLPDKNIGNDIDFLILPDQYETVLKVISEINGVNIVGILKRFYVSSVFVNGIEWGDGLNAIQLDFVFSLSWKGMTYLSSETVFKNTRFFESGNKLIKIPTPHHEALVSFFSSYLVGGWIKERYQEKVTDMFKRHSVDLLNDLTPILGLNLSTLLVDFVSKDDRNALYEILPKIRARIIFYYLSKNPVNTLITLVNYYIPELKIRFTSYPITSVVFLGPDGSGKSSVINGVIPALKNTAKSISRDHLKPSLHKKDHSSGVAVTDPHALPPRSAWVSCLKLGYWLFLYWYDLFFGGHKNLTLKIWDRYCYDVLVDPKRYRYGGSMTFARWIAKLAPKPALVILLDAPAEVLYARKQEVSFAETARQREAYLALVNAMDNGVVIDATQPLDQVIQDTCNSIVEMLASRVKQRHEL